MIKPFKQLKQLKPFKQLNTFNSLKYYIFVIIFILSIPIRIMIWIFSLSLYIIFFLLTSIVAWLIFAPIEYTFTKNITVVYHSYDKIINCLLFLMKYQMSLLKHFSRKLTNNI